MSFGKRNVPLRRTAMRGRDSELARRSPVAKVNAKRRRKEFDRAYGGKPRVEWMKRGPCVACGAKQQIEVAHIVTGGMGRKANASLTVRLCSWCHAELHRVGVQTFQATFGLDLRALASETEGEWQRECERRGPRVGGG